MKVMPNPFTFNHFSIVSNHKTDLEKCLDQIFPSLSIKVDPNYYDLSGPNFETRAGFSDNVLFTRTSCDSFSDDLELNRSDVLFCPEQKHKTSIDNKIKECFTNHEASSQPVHKLSSIYSPSYKKYAPSISEHSPQKTEPFNKLLKPATAVGTPNKSSWKKKDALKERFAQLGVREVSKTQCSGKESDSPSLTGDRRQRKGSKNFPFNRRSGTESSMGLPRNRSTGKIPDLFSTDLLTKLTEEPTLEAAEYSVSPDRLLKPVKVPSAAGHDSPSTSRRTIGISKTGKRSRTRLTSSVALMNVNKTNLEERQSAPVGTYIISKSQSPALGKFVQRNTGRIDLYCSGTDEQATSATANRIPPTRMRNKKKLSLQNKSLQYHIDKKLKDDKSFTPLFHQ